MLEHGLDQAAGLRRMMPRPGIGLLAFPLGAGGNEHWIAQLAHALRALGRQPVVVDAAGGAVASAFGLRLRYELIDLLRGEREFDDVARPTRDGVFVLRADRGVEAFVAGGAPATRLLASFGNLSHGFDQLLLAMPAGELACLAGAADSVPVISLEASPGGAVASYSMMKQLAEGFGYRRFTCVVRDVHDEPLARREYDRLAAAAARFLQADLGLAGCMPPREQASPSALARVAQTLLETAAIQLSLHQCTA